MTAIPAQSTLKKPANLRAFDERRDLPAVADLVEMCFEDTLDPDGRLYIKQMRQAARGGSLGQLATRAQKSGPPGGFVWVEEGELIGNLSLIPIQQGGVRRYLIANVAVHPDHRRRGIARALTRAALDDLSRGKGVETWLQVDEGNRAARKLYQGMGFIERVQRCTWQAKPQPDKIGFGASEVRVRSQRGADWNQQKEWLDQIYPRNLWWNLPFDIKLFESGFLGSVQRLLGEREIQQWSAVRSEELLGVLSWQSSSLHADRLWLATSPEHEELALPALLRHAHLHLRLNRDLALNYPMGRAEALFQQAGFSAARRLIWMQYVGGEADEL